MRLLKKFRAALEANAASKRRLMIDEKTTFPVSESEHINEIGIHISEVCKPDSNKTQVHLLIFGHDQSTLPGASSDIDKKTRAIEGFYNEVRRPAHSDSDPEFQTISGASLDSSSDIKRLMEGRVTPTVRYEFSAEEAGAGIDKEIAALVQKGLFSDKEGSRILTGLHNWVKETNATLTQKFLPFTGLDPQERQYRTSDKMKAVPISVPGAAPEAI